MRIALISDIHSNYIAFKAVLDDLKRRNLDEVFFLGDYAFGGSGSAETVDALMSFSDLPCIIIKGNKEDYIEPIENNETWIFPEMHAIYNELGKERIDWLKNLPSEVIVNREGKMIRLCHNPSKLKMFVVVDRLHRRNNYPNSESLRQLSMTMTEDICIFGHYHLFMNETINDKIFICASSVGLPFNGDSRAQYVIMDITSHNLSFELCYTGYDHLALIKDFELKNYFEKYNVWSLNTAISMIFAKNYIGTQHKGD
jgi:putative phosphoesterase